jgi:arylsulfatase A-like enzyme
MVFALAIAGTLPAAPVSAAGIERPNVLIILSDDQAWSTFSRRLMPAVYRELVDRGVLFKQGYVNTPLCCPSRAEILTGLYQHHTGVVGNLTPLLRPTIVEALHDRGYRTMLAGKYLNSMPCEPLPEFDRWVCSSVAPSDYSLTDPLLNVDGRWQRFGGYTTTILARQAARFIKNTPSSQPFFVLYSPTSPHLPADDDRYEKLAVRPRRGPAFDQETRLGNMPSYLHRGPLDALEVWQVDSWYRDMARAVRALDDSVALLLDSLGPRARDTLVIYLSDNGFLYGEHRRWDKEVPYQESIRVPFVVRYPALIPVGQPFASWALVQNVDVAVTVAELAGFDWGADGRSLVPVLSGQAAAMRDAVLIEHCVGLVQWCPGGRPGFLGQVTVPAFWGVVTATHKYVEYGTGERELYDLVADPSELRNLAGRAAQAVVQTQLAATLAALRAPPPPETTIVSGPRETAADDAVTFRYFSQSVRATYSCRLDTVGVPGTWVACNGQSFTVGPLAQGDYTFLVAGTDPRTGLTDPSPAAWPFMVAAPG